MDDNEKRIIRETNRQLSSINGNLFRLTKTIDNVTRALNALAEATKENSDGDVRGQVSVDGEHADNLPELHGEGGPVQPGG